MKTKTKKRRNNKINKSQRARKGTRYWITMSAMGAMMAYNAVGGISLAPSYANSLRIGQSQRVPAQQGTTSQQFDIPRGTLEVVLDSLQTVTRWKFSFSREDIRHLISPGVSGMFTAEQALQQSLFGTGVTYTIEDQNSILLLLGGPSDSVEIIGTASVISSPKYAAALRDIPQTIAVIPKAVIEEQGATTLRDVLRNVSGLTMTAGEGGTPAGDNLTLRGFSARNDVFVDGVRDLSPQGRDPFNLEQVEIVKGPSSAFSGRGSTGGTINLVSKSPSLASNFGLALNFGSDKTRRLTADLNLPLDRIGLGKHTALRLNFLAHESGVADRDVVENQRWGFAPSLAFGLGSPQRLTLSYFKLKQDNISDYGIPWVPATNNTLKDFRDKPAPVPRNTFYGLKNRDAEKLDSDLVTFKYERDFDNLFSLRNQFRYGNSTRDSIATPPRFASNDSTVINRELRSWITRDKIWDNQTDLRAGFSTGRIRHTITGGLDLTSESNQRKTRSAPNMQTTLFNPNPNDVYTGTMTLSPLVGDVSGKSLAAYAFDTVKFGERFEVSSGLRYDYFDVDGVTTINAPVTRIDRMLSWRSGVVYKPQKNGSIYASYGTSLNPSLEGLSYGTANTAIDPEKTYTFEVGSKWDFFKERLAISGATFQIDKTNARTPGALPDDPPQVLAGQQRVRGVEIGASGSLTRDLSIFASYTLLDSEIVKSNTPSEVGKALQNTPKNSLSLWTIYRLPLNLSFGGGARFVDKRFGNNTNTRQVDSYWTVDAMAAYPLNEHLDLRLNLYNLTNTYYFDRLGGGHLIPGAGRTVNLSLGLRF